MTRRRISSLPAGIVIAALAVIALVAIVALSLFGGSSESSPTANGWLGTEQAGE